ncbi:MAG: hypothetical protein WCK27_22555 [Verrucomicrobiota bacterium]
MAVLSGADSHECTREWELLFVTNTIGSAQNFAFGVNGLNCATDDYDVDGLPDCWELTYWPSIYSYGPNDDPDVDGVRNLDEYLEGTDPTNPLSFHPRLLLSAQFGTVNANPAGNATTTPPKVWYNLGQIVLLTPVPSAGYGFLGWGGDASGASIRLSVPMNGHSNSTAIFGCCWMLDVGAPIPPHPTLSPEERVPGPPLGMSQRHNGS